MLCKTVMCQIIVLLGLYVYTWTNSHAFCKLDRLMVNQLWLNMYKDSVVQFYPPRVSDHSYSIISVFQSERVRVVPFRIKNIWVQDESCIPLVTKAWNTPVHGCLMFG